jgi:hypothetical protein
MHIWRIDKNSDGYRYDTLVAVRAVVVFVGLAAVIEVVGRLWSVNPLILDAVLVVALIIACVVISSVRKARGTLFVRDDADRLLLIRASGPVLAKLMGDTTGRVPAATAPAATAPVASGQGAASTSSEKEGMGYHQQAQLQVEAERLVRAIVRDPEKFKAQVFELIHIEKIEGDRHSISFTAIARKVRPSGGSGDNARGRDADGLADDGPRLTESGSIAASLRPMGPVRDLPGEVGRLKFEVSRMYFDQKALETALRYRSDIDDPRKSESDVDTRSSSADAAPKPGNLSADSSDSGNSSGAAVPNPDSPSGAAPNSDSASDAAPNPDRASGATAGHDADGGAGGDASDLESDGGSGGDAKS